MITIHLGDFIIGVTIGFLLSIILMCMLSIRILPKKVKHGYQPIKSGKPFPPKETVGIGSKGEDA